MVHATQAVQEKTPGWDIENFLMCLLANQSACVPAEHLERLLHAQGRSIAMQTHLALRLWEQETPSSDLVLKPTTDAAAAKQSRDQFRLIYTLRNQPELRRCVARCFKRERFTATRENAQSLRKLAETWPILAHALLSYAQKVVDDAYIQFAPNMAAKMSLDRQQTPPIGPIPAAELTPFLQAKAAELQLDRLVTQYRWVVSDQNTVMFFPRDSEGSQQKPGQCDFLCRRLRRQGLHQAADLITDCCTIRRAPL